MPKSKIAVIGGGILRRALLMRQFPRGEGRLAFAVLAAGSLPGPVAIPLNLPVVPQAIGLQVSVQSALSGPVGAASSFAMTSATGFVVR